MASEKDESGREELAQPSPVVPQRSQKPEAAKRIPMARPGFGTDGRRIQLLTNHFSVRFSGNDAVFYQYSVLKIFLSFKGELVDFTCNC